MRAGCEALHAPKGSQPDDLGPPKNGWLLNNNCACKGIWLDTSRYGSTSDRYRLHMYYYTSVLTSSGARYAQAIGSAETYRPVAEYYGGPGVFWAQIVRNPANGSIDEQFVTEGSPTYPILGGSLFATYLHNTPQAYRALEFGVAAALAAACTTSTTTWVRSTKTTVVLAKR